MGFSVGDRKVWPTLAGMTEAIDNPRVRLVATLKVPHSDNCSGVSESGSVICEDNPYLGDFSHRVAARLAGLPKVNALRGLESEDELRISWHLFRRSSKLVLAVMVGAILYGGIVYSLLSELRSPRASAGAIATPAATSR